LAQCISGIVNDKVIIAQFPVSNNIAELPGLVLNCGDRDGAS